MCLFVSQPQSHTTTTTTTTTDGIIATIALALAEAGKASEVDLLVGDIYGGDYSEFDLPSDTVAASLGKCIRPSVREDAKPADLARALLDTVTNNIGSIAMLHARGAGVRDILFAGSFLRHNNISSKCKRQGMQDPKMSNSTQRPHCNRLLRLCVDIMQLAVSSNVIPKELLRGWQQLRLLIFHPPFIFARLVIGMCIIGVGCGSLRRCEYLLRTRV